MLAAHAISLEARLLCMNSKSFAAIAGLDLLELAKNSGKSEGD